MSHLIFQKTHEGRVARLELNLPEKRNALSSEIIQALTSRLEALEKDTDIHALILSGRGGHFCAGADLNWLALSKESSDAENMHQIQPLSKMFWTLARFPLPVIGKLKGSVFGGGIGIAALCDIAVAHKDARFCFSELKLALIPALIAPFVLQKASPGKVRELMFSAREFSAKEAMDLSLAHFLGSAEECESYIDKLLTRFLSFDRAALRQTKKLLNVLPGLPEKEIKNYTAQALAERRKSAEAARRIQKFLKALPAQTTK